MDSGRQTRLRALAMQFHVSIDELPPDISVEQIRAERERIGEEIKARYRAGDDGQETALRVSKFNTVKS